MTIAWRRTNPLLGLMGCLLLTAPAGAQPVADAGEDVTVECSNGGARVTLDGTASSVGAEISYLWEGEGVVFEDPTLLTPTGHFPPGTTEVSLTVTETPVEGEPSSSEDFVLVTVSDTSPPTLDATATPSSLWPPNHTLRHVEITLDVHDGCDEPLDLEVILESVTSSEPDNGTGDGNTVDDVQEADEGSDDRELLLRAERAGGGPGRIYTATYRVTDREGNTTVAVATVEVPHDQSAFAEPKPTPVQDARAKADAAMQAYRAAKQELKAMKAQLKSLKKVAKAARKEARRASKGR